MGVYIIAAIKDEVLFIIPPPHCLKTQGALFDALALETIRDSAFLDHPLLPNPLQVLVQLPSSWKRSLKCCVVDG